MARERLLLAVGVDNVVAARARDAGDAGAGAHLVAENVGEWLQVLLRQSLPVG